MKTQAIVAAAIALAATACSKDGAQTATVTEELPKVIIDVVHSTAVPQTKQYTANIEAENVNNISPASPNRIKAINVEVGDRVHKGQVLVQLDRANIDQLRINLEQIEREYNRAKTLLEIGGGTQQAVDQLKAQLDAARTQYNNLMENTTLISPINGVVTARNYVPGDMTGAQPVLTVGQLAPVVKVLVGISETDMAKVSNGMPVQVSVDAFPDETFSGKVNRIYPTVDPSTRTFQAEIRIANPKEQLKPGMFARVDFDLGTVNNVVVPDRAVVKQTGSGNKYIYTYSNGRVSYKKVELGQRLGDSYELLGGVADGDTVVIAGQSRLADGVEVTL